MTVEELHQIKQNFSDMENKPIVEQNRLLFNSMELVSKYPEIDLILEPDYIYIQLNKFSDRALQLLGFDEIAYFDQDESESVLMKEMSTLIKTYDSQDGFSVKRLNHFIHILDAIEIMNDIEMNFGMSRLGGIYDMEIEVLNKIEFIVQEMITEELNIC